MAVLYGAAVLGDIDYETYTGLYLNRHRAHTRSASVVTAGVGFAISEKMPASWFDAMSEDEFEAVAAKAQYEAERRKKR